MVLQVDLGKQANLDDLPHQAEDQVLTPLNQILRANVDDAASNRLGGINDDIVVFRLLERIELALVQHALVNRVRHRVVNQLAIARASVTPKRMR